MSQAPVVPVVECSGVTKRYGAVAAVEGLSFALQPGEILSILGPSGSGKTTVLRLIAGFESPDRGEIRIQGRVVSGAAVHVPPNRRNVGMVFQEYALFPHLTVAQNVSFGLRRMSREEREQRLAEVLALAGLDGLEQRYPHELSGGQQQRVALARTIAPRPITVLLDEPFSNLDAGMRRRLRQEVADILRAHTIATVFVTHDREEAFAMADRVAVMNEGHLEQLDTPDRIYHAPATPFVAQLAGTCDFLPRGGPRRCRSSRRSATYPMPATIAARSRKTLLGRPAGPPRRRAGAAASRRAWRSSACGSFVGTRRFSSYSSPPGRPSGVGNARPPP